jgi:hypothetical protein
MKRKRSDYKEDCPKEIKGEGLVDTGEQRG